MISSTLLKGTLKTILKTKYHLHFLTPFRHWEILLQIHQDWKFYHKKHSRQKSNTNAYILYPVPLVTYREGFFMNTGNKNLSFVEEDSSSSQQSKSLLLVFVSVKSKNRFPPLKGSISCGTVGYDTHKYAEIEFTVNHLFITMTLQELNTLHPICELERAQLLNILAESVQNP